MTKRTGVLVLRMRVQLPAESAQAVVLPDLCARINSTEAAVRRAIEDVIDAEPMLPFIRVGRVSATWRPS